MKGNLGKISLRNSDSRFVTSGSGGVRTAKCERVRAQHGNGVTRSPIWPTRDNVNRVATSRAHMWVSFFRRRVDNRRRASRRHNWIFTRDARRLEIPRFPVSFSRNRNGHIPTCRCTPFCFFFSLDVFHLRSGFSLCREFETRKIDSPSSTNDEKFATMKSARFRIFENDCTLFAYADQELDVFALF